MLNWLVATALHQRVLVMAIAAVLVLLGIRATGDVELDVFPEFAPPQVEVQTEAPGLSTEEVEALVTIPLEAGLGGVTGIKTLRSKSVLGLSSVVLIFKQGSDLAVARQYVQERLATVAPTLPAAVETPVMLPPLSATSRAMKIGISSDTMDQMAMSDIVRWTIRPRLMAVQGVANVAVWGQRDRQLQVLVDPERLAAAGVTLGEIEKAAAGAAAAAGGGFVDTANQRIAVRHISPALGAAELAATPVRLAGGAAIRLGDVATVTEGHGPPIGDAIIDDKPGLLLIVEKQQGGNTLAVTRGVEAALAELAPALAGLKVDPTIFRPATFIERSLDNLLQALAIGCLLVALILIVFTRNWRPALISLTAIPLSLLGAALMLSWLGASINTMVIAGLVIALGEIVDDAIIDVENIGRRLRLERAADNPRSPFAVVLAASLEVRSAIVFASLIVILVFLPIFFLDGVSGTFFRPLATAYVLAIATSLLVALTITPALCLWLLPGDAAHRDEPMLVRWLKARYRRVLPDLVGRPGLAVAIIAGGILFSVVGYSSFKQQFLPDFRETDFLMHFVEKPGIGIEAMDRITIRASKELRAIPGVRNFGSHIGRAEAGDEVYGPNFTELWISLDENADYEASVARIKAAIDGYPGLYRDVLTYLRERIKEVLTGAGATVVVRIYGPDVEMLRARADAVKAAIANVPGVANLKVEQQSLIPQIQIVPRAEALALNGMTSSDLRRATATLIAGTKVGEIYRDQRSIEVAVWGVKAVRDDPGALAQIPITTPSGGRVKLGDVAEVLINPAANEIKRESGSRRIDVTMNIENGDLGAVARAVEAKVSAMPFPPGYYPEFLGEYAALQQSEQRLFSLGLLALAGILLLTWMHFRSWRLTALIALGLPFSLLGGVVAVMLSGGTMSLGALVGFVTVFGISARNGIMLVSHFRHLEREEGESFGRALIVRGAEERLVPILMTAICAALALLPLVVRGNVPGHEIEHPMALVILGGLVSATALNLLLMPALYARFARATPA